MPPLPNGHPIMGSNATVHSSTDPRAGRHDTNLIRCQGQHPLSVRDTDEAVSSCVTGRDGISHEIKQKAEHTAPSQCMMWCTIQCGDTSGLRPAALIQRRYDSSANSYTQCLSSYRLAYRGRTYTCTGHSIGVEWLIHDETGCFSNKISIPTSIASC
jgi:hypothetical protein